MIFTNLVVIFMFASGRGSFGVSARFLLDESINKALVIPTGCDGIDGLLGGGISTQEILEIVGHTATGKTQLCMQCLLHTVVTGDEVTALYIDTGSSFSAKRLHEMFDAQVGLSQEDNGDEDKMTAEEEFLVHVLSKVKCFSVFDAFKLLDILEDIYLQLKLQEDEFFAPLRLIVIDSLAAVISPILGGKQSIGHSVMMQLSRLMKAIAFEFHVAIVYTNYTVSSRVEGGNNKRKPALGESWLPVPHHRLLLSGKEDIRRAELIKSTSLPCGNRILFLIESGGVCTNENNIIEDEE